MWRDAAAGHCGPGERDPVKRRAFAISALLATPIAGFGALDDDLGTMEFYNGFDENKPTIIGVHGWFGSISYESTFGRSPTFADNANVIGWEWDAAAFVRITEKARRSGRELAREFHTFLMENAPNYAQPIQLAGHSLGTHVVLETAAELREIGRDDPNYATYQADHVTLVDTGFNANIPKAIANIEDDYLVELKLDNYWSPEDAGGTGSAYDGGFVNVRVPLEHVTLWYWYFASLDDQPVSRIKPGGAYSLVGQFSGYNLRDGVAVMTTGDSTPLDLSDDTFRREN